MPRRLHRKPLPESPSASGSIEEALDRLALLDLRGAAEAFEHWLASLDQGSAQAAAISFLLFDAVCQAHRTAQAVKPIPALTEDRRLLLAQRLGVCETSEERAQVFRAAVREVLGALSDGPMRSPAVERARDYVHSNFTRKLSLPEVARFAGISPNYLSHLFRKQCGATLTQFVNKLRVREALRLLRGGSKSISEIAYLVGYQNYRDFHRNFVKIERSPPKRYRSTPRPRL